MSKEDQAALRARNLRTGLIAGSIALTLFVGVILRRWMMG